MILKLIFKKSENEIQNELKSSLLREFLNKGDSTERNDSILAIEEFRFDAITFMRGEIASTTSE
jgi:hypothetical protein